jgi:hypothetical protein
MHQLIAVRHLVAFQIERGLAYRGQAWTWTAEIADPHQLMLIDHVPLEPGAELVLRESCYHFVADGALNFQNYHWIT